MLLVSNILVGEKNAFLNEKTKIVIFTTGEGKTD